MKLAEASPLAEVGGVRVRWRTKGAGAPLLFLHGMGASLYSFRHQLDAFAERHTVHCFDWPGYGASDQPADFDYSPEGYSRFLVAHLDRLGLEKAHLAGNSMGGLVALWTALHRPERVDRLVLIGAPVYPADRPAIIWPLRWPVLGALYAKVLGPWAIPLVARTCFVDKTVITEELVAEYAEAFRRPGGSHAVRTFLQRAVPADPESFTRRYRELPHPTLVLRGDHDGVVKAESAARFASEHPKARLITLPNLGHAPHEERPDVVNPLILDFLR
ncbi:MAG: alpha/beta hydrolase [Elusimicrobia bacterium]|nr:alpha/beta hydrolase [Elusimicrobiota bacterium]